MPEVRQVVSGQPWSKSRQMQTQDGPRLASLVPYATQVAETVFPPIAQCGCKRVLVETAVNNAADH